MDPNNDEEVTVGAADSTHSAGGDMTMPAPEMMHPHAASHGNQTGSADEADVAMTDEDEDEDTDEDDDEDEDEEGQVKHEVV
jgi:hypothetical protein